MLQQPVVHRELRLAQKPTRGIRSELHPYNVHQAARGGSEGLFAKRTRQQLAPLDDNLRIDRRHAVRLSVLVPRCSPSEVDRRQEQRYKLLAGPQRPGLEDGWRGNVSVPILEPHEQVAEYVVLDERVPLREQAGRQQRVLHNPHHGFVGLRRDDVTGDRHDLLDLGTGLLALHEMHVHLITIEIGVVWRRYRQVEPERGVREDADTVTHHGHFMQRWLTVEDDHVAIHHVPFYDVSRLQMAVPVRPQKPEIEPGPVISDNVLGPRLSRWRVRPVFYELAHLLDVVRGNHLRKGQIERDGPGYTELVQRQVRIARDDSSGREIDTLPHQVPTHPALLSFEPLRD